MSVLISVEEFRKACLACGAKKLIDGVFQAPGFCVEYNNHGFYRGFNKESQQLCFLLELQAAREIAAEIQVKHGINLQRALSALAAAAHEHKGEHYSNEEEISIESDDDYWEIMKDFKTLAKQAKVQVLYSDVRNMLSQATELSQPVDLLSSEGSGQPVHMFMAIDFEWWEKSDEHILEIGWSLWDTLTCKHRSRHWIIKENLNKSNGRFISDNRMRFMFGVSERGSLDKAMDALQDEVDNLGLTEGLSYQQKQAVKAAGVQLVLVGHAMAQDLEQAHLYEVEFPEDMRKFDTQKLFMAWQLQRLDAASASQALQEVVGRGAGKAQAGFGLARPTLEAVGAVGELSDDDDDDDDDSDDLHAGVPIDRSDDEDGEEGLNDAVAAVASRVAALKPGSSGSDNGSSTSNQAAAAAGSKGKKGRPKGKAQVQNPPRVRPWPHGPAPEGNECPTGLSSGAAAAKKKGNAAQQVKVDHQASLQTVLGALDIKSSKLHNAGNDARFTMEAFLALTGHEICTDPAEAHQHGCENDDRYRQQLEASMRAAREQGWGAPAPPRAGSASSNGARAGSSGNKAAAQPTATRPPPGFGGSPVPAAVPGTQHAAVPPGFEGRPAAFANKSPAWSRALADVLQGQQQTAAASPTPGNKAVSPASNAWGAAGGAATAARPVSPASNAWGAAGGAATAARPAWGRQQASPAPAAPTAWDVGGSSDAGSEARGTPQQRNAAKAAWDSTVDHGVEAATYQPSADGW